jgi:hypothetical protein
LRRSRSTINQGYQTLLTVPKKTKTVENKSEPPAESGAPAEKKNTGKRRDGRRVTTVKKPRKRAATKNIDGKPAQISASPQAEPTFTSGEPSEEEVRLRAYFISERRRRFALAGDADSDWLEARRQLLTEERR